MSHKTARSDDARDKLTIGQVLPAVIIETDVDEEGTALTKHQKIKIFVKSDDADLEWGETVLIKIVDVGPSHAESILVGTTEN